MTDVITEAAIERSDVHDVVRLDELDSSTETLHRRSWWVWCRIGVLVAVVVVVVVQVR